MDLLFEEQERVLRFLGWHADWWTAKANARVVDDPTLADGLRAYAERQASIRHALKQRFQHVWRNTHYFLAIADKAQAGVSDVMDTTVTELVASM